MEIKSTTLLRDLIKPAVSHPTESKFQAWMTEHGIDPRELEVYDFRATMMAGAERDPSGHWPSNFKRASHPNLVVGGFNTKTGQRVPGSALASSVQELVELGWDPQAAQRLWASVKGK